jgi:choline dehydrogenase-like flavoprotein
MPGVKRSSRDPDVLVVGAGPGGTTAATFLARGGLRVAVAEREATFHDQELGRETTFDFRPGGPWPACTLDVHRVEFDQILLESRLDW